MKAYAYYSSISEDDELVLCVSPQSRFRVTFYRHQAPEGFAAAGSVEGIVESGAGTPEGRPDEDWAWPTVRCLPLPSSGEALGRWTPGVHVAIVWECDCGGAPLDETGRRALQGEAPPHLTNNAAMFVVNPSQPVSPIAYIVPLATMHAYNFAGGGCLYEYRNPPAARLRSVTMRRPGFGIGGPSREADDCYDPASPRQAFAHWDAKMLNWLRRHGFAPDCYTDLDLDRRDILTGHKLMISAGHHEYWSQPMRDRVRRFLDDGGNVAIFSGNTCYRKISFGTDFTITRENEAWPDSNEAGLTGVSYSQGGGWWGRWRDGAWCDPERSPCGYTVRTADHWIFDSVALGSDLTFGAEDRLLGYECDGVVPGVSPANLTILASGRLEGGWNNGEGRTATMVIFDSGCGIVFNAATTDWARILGAPECEAYEVVSRITHNVVRRLSDGVPVL